MPHGRGFTAPTSWPRSMLGDNRRQPSLARIPSRHKKTSARSDRHECKTQILSTMLNCIL